MQRRNPKKMSESYEVIVVVVTNGKHASSAIFGIISEPTPNELDQILKQELKVAHAHVN
jgi:hypothetical protein